MSTLAMTLRVLRTRLAAALVTPRLLGPLILREIRIVAGSARRAIRSALAATLAMATAGMLLAIAARTAMLRTAARILVRLVLTRFAAFGTRGVCTFLDL